MPASPRRFTAFCPFKIAVRCVIVRESGSQSLTGGAALPSGPEVGMHHPAGVSLLFIALASGPAVASAHAVASPQPNVAEQYLQSAADRERAALGLPPLRLDPALAAAARAHALEMARHNAISHQFANEPALAARSSAAGARFSLISENVAQSPSALNIHDAWMHSDGHRHNLLDPGVDVVGIAVVARGSQLFAVEDFAHLVAALTLGQQEQAVAALVSATGTAVLAADPAARQTCLDDTGSVSTNGRRPAFVVRYTTANLQQIPDALRSRLASRDYPNAMVAACPAQDPGEFTMYRLAVLLYR